MRDNLLDGEYLITKDYTDWMVKTGGYAKDMTLRDHFAGLAMSGLVGAWGAHDVQDYTEIASDAYLLADAMLKERSK
jgi:hypothetical protein